MKPPSMRACVLVTLIACLLLAVDARHKKKHKKCNKKSHKHRHKAGEESVKTESTVNGLVFPVTIASVEAYGQLDYRGQLVTCPPYQTLKCTNCTESSYCLEITCAEKARYNAACSALDKLTCTFAVTCECDNSKNYFRKSADDPTCVLCP